MKFALIAMAAAALASSSSSSSSPRDSDFIVDVPKDPHYQRRQKCNPVQRVKEFIELFNENRYSELDAFYTEDALRFNNGLLDPATRGRPVTGEQFVELRKLYPMRYEARQITRSGDWAVAVTGSLFVGGAVEPARGLGWGIVYEFRHGDRCLIQVERHHSAQDTIAYERLREASCAVFEPLAKTDSCRPDEDGAVDVPAVNPAETVKAAWQAVANGNAAAAAGYFAPGAVAAPNGIPDAAITFSVAAFWSSTFGAVAFENVRIESLIVEGNQVQAAVGFTLFVKGTGKRYPGQLHQAFTTDSAGIITRLAYTFGPGTAVEAFEMATGAGINLKYWTNTGAAAAAAAAVQTLGAPTVKTNTGSGHDYLFWGTQTLRNNNAPRAFAEVWAMDGQTTHTVTAPSTGNRVSHADFLSCQAFLPVTAAKIDEVRAISTSILYDALAERVWSNGYNVHHCAVDFWLAARVAAGQVTLGDAQNEYITSLNSIEQPGAFRDRVYNELRTLIG